MIKDDERRLLEMMLERGTVWDDRTEGEPPRDLGLELGMNHRRLVSICLKWARKGWFDHGASPDLGWIRDRDAAEEHLRRY